MKTVILDYKSMGLDLPLERLEKISRLTVYGSSTPEEAKARIAEAEVVLINKFRFTSEIMDWGKNLKLICIFATGYDNIDVSAARQRGIAVCNVPAYSTESVALFTVSTALALASHLREYTDYVRSGEYSASGFPNKITPVYHELAGKTWGILGCGNIGRRVAEIAKAFGMNVLVTKRTPIAEYECVDIDTLCEKSDILSLHCPLNDSTRGILNGERIGKMKNSAILVNESRGAVTDEKSVAEAIKGGKIAAFGADVYSNEPFGTNHPFYEIKNMENVLLTPHTAWAAYEARVRCLDIICDNILAFSKGERKNRVD